MIGKGLRWLGTILLFLVVALSFAPTLVPPFLDRIYYAGPVSDHYNGHRFFAGTYLTAGAAKFSQGLSTATQQDATVFFQLFAGIRLQAPKSIDRIFDKF